VYDRGREAQKTLQAFRSGGAPKEKIIEMYRRSGADIAMFKAAQAVAEKMGQVSKRARLVESSPEHVLSRAEKRKQLDELAAMRNEMAKKFMEQYHQVDLDSLQREIEASLSRLGRD
jgi:hypothetical protein